MAVRTIFLFLFLFIVLLAAIKCTSSRNSTSKKNAYKDLYVEQFKLTYFRQLLRNSYNNSAAIQEVIQSDHSGFTEPILLTAEDYKLIDSLTKIDNERMKIDSTDGMRRAEGSQGKRPLGFIIHTLNSKWLDNLARKRFKVRHVRSRFTD
jgi:hypothetical protein